MGILAVTSHATGAKHKRNCAIVVKTPDITSFFGQSSNKDKPVTLSLPEPSQNQSDVMHDHPVVVQHVEPNRVTLKDFGFKNDLFKAEILWALCSTDAHLSNRQSEKLSQTFKLMFPDSQVAEWHGTVGRVARHWWPSGIIPDLQFWWPVIDSHSGQNVCEETLTL